MSTKTLTQTTPQPSPGTDFDAVVVGAGFAGIHMLYKLDETGMSVRLLEAGADVGGTWFWNSYPGARTDSESWVYSYAFSKELQDEWDWSERFPTQPEALAYLRYAVKKYGLRPHIQFETRLEAASYDEESHTWALTTDRGDTVTCTYLITAVGRLAAPYVPSIPGLDTFEGRVCMTAQWPAEDVDLAGKKVIVVGTGATAVQLIPIVARLAAQLTVLQRTPNYVIPATNHVVSKPERRDLQARYDEVWAQVRRHLFGLETNSAGGTAADLRSEERVKILENSWEMGGFRFLFEIFDDILLDTRSSAVAADFVRNKIRTIVHDPATAELLCPKDLPLAGKRPPFGHFYYETYNRDNVTLVDVSQEPIAEVTPRGVRVGDVVHGADILIIATGCSAAGGSLIQMDIRGKRGAALEETWAKGPRTHLGMAVEGFPNMFMIFGPHLPFAHAPVVMEGMVSWIGSTLRHARENEISTIEATADAEDRWAEHVAELVDASALLHGRDSWFGGNNMVDKKQVALLYFGGVGASRAERDERATHDLEGFTLTKN